MDARAFELMLITPEGDYPEESSWVNRLFGEGLGTLHLRKPGWEAERLLRYLDKIDPHFHSRIMLHHDPTLLDITALKGFHYRCTDLPTQKPDWMLSCSTHSWQEFMQVSKEVDYAFISPFFDSISKEGYRANGSLKAIPEQADKRKAVALGGINAGNMEQLRRLGLKGAAVLGTIWQAADPLEAYRKLSIKAEEWQKNDLM